MTTPTTLRNVLILVTSIFAISCLDTPAPDEDVRVEVRFEVDNLGEPIVSGTDSLIVDELKFSMDRFILVDTDSTVLESTSQVDTFIFFYDKDLTEENLIFSTLLGFQDITKFQSYELFLEPVNNADSISDTDFFGEENNYSFIMKGQFNGNDFDYQSSPTETRLFEFPVVNISSQNETLLLQKSVDAADLFFNESGEMINPRDSTNREQIDSLLLESLELNASAADLIN